MGSVGFWVKVHGTHNAPFFPVREVVLPWTRKENISDLLAMGIGEALMQWRSKVYIIEEFASFFYVAFDASIWGILRGWERSLYKWFVGGGALLCQ